MNFAALTSLLLATAKTGQIPSSSAEANLGLCFVVLGAALGALSSVCFSYGIVRFQSSDRIFLGVQVLLALGLTWQGARESGLVPPPPGYGAGIVLPLLLIDFLGAAGFVSLVLRPACWKAHPLITGCLTAGGIVSLLLGSGVFSFLPADLQTRLFHGVGLMSGALFLLGVLLLIRSKLTRSLML